MAVGHLYVFFGVITSVTDKRNFSEKQNVQYQKKRQINQQKKKKSIKYYEWKTLKTSV